MTSKKEARSGGRGPQETPDERRPHDARLLAGAKGTAGTQSPSVAERLYANGFFHELLSVIPPAAPLIAESKVKPESRGKAPGRKLHSGHWAGSWLRAGSKEHAAQFARDGANIGLETTRVIPLDLDVNDPALHAPLLQAVRDWCCDNTADRRPAPVRRGARPLLFWRMKGECSIGRSSFTFTLPSGGETTHKVETFFGEYKQFVVAGTHPSGMEYTCEPPAEKIKFDKLPWITEAEMRALLQYLATALQQHHGATVIDEQNVARGDRGEQPDPEALTAPVEAVRAALGNLANTKGRDRWVEVCHAVKGATLKDPEKGKELWLEWCETRVDADGNPDDPHLDDAERVWQSAGKRGLHIGYDALLHFADMRAELAAREFDDEPLPANAEPAPGLFRIVTFDRAAALVRPKWVIQNVLPDEAGFGVLYGPPGSNKSTLATTFAVHIALGLPLNGNAVKEGKVLVIAQEDALVNKRRLIAWEQHLRSSADYGLAEETLCLLPGRILMPCAKGFGHMNKKHMLHLASELDKHLKDEDVPLRFIYFDTLARTMPEGGEENNGADMGKYIDHAEWLAARYNCPVFALHHPPKGADTLRGHSSLLGAISMSWKVERDDINTVRLHCEKQRGAPEFAPMQFRPIAQDLTLLCAPADNPVDDIPVKALILEPEEYSEPASATKGKGRRTSASEDFPNDATEKRPLRPVTDVDVLRILQDVPNGSLDKWYPILGCSRSALDRKLKSLKRNGCLADQDVRGKWCITDAGRQAFAENAPDGLLY